MQVRKVDCVSTTMAMAMEMPQQHEPMANTSSSSYASNGQNLDYYYLSDSVSGNNNNNNDDNERRTSIDAVETVQANGNEANRNNQAATMHGQHLQCDPKTKPIATQPCTTGIECTPITLGTGNIDRGRGDDGTELVERPKIDDDADADGDDDEATDTNGKAGSATDEIGVDGNERTENGSAEIVDGEGDADELEEIEVF